MIIKKGQNSYLIFIFHPLITYYYKIYFFLLMIIKGGGWFVCKLYSHDTDRGLLVSSPGVISLLGCRTFKEVPAPDFSAIVDTDSLAVGRKTENWKLNNFFILLLLYWSILGNARHQKNAKKITGGFCM